MNKIKKGMRVKYIFKDTDLIRASGFYPPIGTMGTVVNVDTQTIEVQWDSGTKDPGVWWCYPTDVEIVEV